MKALLRLALLILIAGLLILISCDRSESDAASRTESTRDAPPVVTSVADRLAEFKGKIVLLNLWATWCPPCRVEIPDLITLNQKYAAQGFAVIGVSLDQIDPRGGGGARAVPPFVERMGINYPVWIIDDYRALKGYEMGAGYPTSYLIGRDGRIVKQYVGAYPLEAFEDDIKPIL